MLFGDVWADNALSPRDRSLVTIATLVGLYRHNELGFHLGEGLENGLTRNEIVAAITHTAFDASWPTAMAAVNVARDALKDA
ncbi:4-carboxymuconolactone decarboxylase [Sphingomonas aerophila]|uniref:4-carboxymuconolactone decarboxylase n=1 Tax=Sphingomonas aerophila TaxID=1344948 RepID=A0A7W9BG95_9SPHN|nr:4-carboxymuconolactone decarboxylase [Sphingomonas aerophila]